MALLPTEPLLEQAVSTPQAEPPAAAQFLALQVGCGFFDIQARKDCGGSRFKVIGNPGLENQERQHDQKNHRGVLYAAEHPYRGHGNDDKAHGFDDIGPERGVFQGMRGIWAEKAAASLPMNHNIVTERAMINMI